MVLLILTNKGQSELIYETTIEETINNCTINITKLYNLYIICNTLIYNTKQLLTHIDDNNNNIKQQLINLLNESESYISPQSIKSRRPTQSYQLQQYIDNINELLKQLPNDILDKYQPLQQYINNNNNDTQILIDEYNIYLEQPSNPSSDNILQYKLYDIDKSIIWFANKPWLRNNSDNNNNKISQYIGNNNKSILKIQLAHNVNNQPNSTNQIDINTKKAIMSYYQKQQQEQDELNKSNNTGSDYNSPWADPNALKHKMYGLTNINFK